MTTVNKTAGGRKSSQSPAATTNAASKASSPTANSCTRTDFALLSLKGVLVKAALRSGDFLEGIFDALDHDKRTISLRLVRKLSSVEGEETGGQKEATITSLALSELICLTSEPVNFAEATGGQTFATDAEISGSAGPLRERELARWEGSSEGAEALVGSLEEEAGPPGVGWDQFDANKRLFGVETSFDEAQYTTIIDRNSEEYRKLERKAERLAAEITGSTANAAATGNINNVHLAEERGLHVDDGQMDEEDRYGAVVRPPSSPGRTMEPAPGKSPVSFREAALSGSTSMVTMPKYTTSASSSTVKSGQSSGQLSSPTLSESEAGAPAPLSSSARPRKSIANLHVDPTALEQARESVNQATDAIQRRMSQVQVEIGKEEQEKKAALNPNAAVFVPGAPFSSSNPGASVAVNSAASETPTLSTSIGASASSGAGKTTTFNPNAAAYVPSSYVPSAPAPAPAPAPAYGYGYGYNPHHYASNSYQQPYAGGVSNAGYYNQGSYYNPYQYYRYHHPNQGSHSQQHYQQASLPLEPQSQLNDDTATSAPSHLSTSLDL